MDNQLILLDTSVLIDFFRKKNKANSAFYALTSKYSNFAVSTITRFEILVGQNNKQTEFWTAFYNNVRILDFDDKCAFSASEIVKQLKKDNKMIEIADILIAATALSNNLPIASLNKKHFDRIENLVII